MFNIVEPDALKRDAQIEVLERSYVEHRERLSWDEKKNRLRLPPEASRP